MATVPDQCCREYVGHELYTLRHAGRVYYEGKTLVAKRLDYEVRFAPTRKKVNGVFQIAYRCQCPSQGNPGKFLGSSVSHAALSTGLPCPCVSELSGLVTRANLLRALSGECGYCNALVGVNLLALSGLIAEAKEAAEIRLRRMEWIFQHRPDLWREMMP